MDFLQLREDYKIAYGRWEQCANRLCELMHCDFGTLEQALLEQGGRHRELVQQYARLGIALDKANDRWDTAQMLQARATAAASQLNHDFRHLEC